MKISLSLTPNWFRKLDKVTSLTSNTIVLVLLAMGYAEDSLIMLIVRIITSYIMNILDIFITDTSVVNRNAGPGGSSNPPGDERPDKP